MKVRKLAVLMLGVLALVASGCGGDDSTAAPDETVVEETTPTIEDTATEETATDDGSETTGEVDLGNLSGDCLELAGIGAKLGEAMGALGGQNTDVGAIADVFDELVGSAPDEIKDDLEVLAGGVAAMAKALEGVDFSSGATPSAEQLAKLQEAIASVDTPALTEASTNVEKWATANCSNS